MSSYSSKGWFHIKISNLIKKLRTERTITQEQLAKGISPRSTLSSLELNGTRISFYLIEQYLARMNVSLNEFELLLHEQKYSEKKELSKTLYHDYYQKNYEAIHVALPGVFEYYQQTKDFYYYSLFAQYSLVLSFKELYPLDTKSLNQVQKTLTHYLDSIETWGAFEFSIFGNTLFVYSTTFILNTIQNLVKKKEAFERLSEIYQIKKKILSNAIFLLFDRKEYDTVEQLLPLFETNLRVEDIDGKLLLQYFQGLLQGNQEGWKTINRVIETFQFVHMDDYADELLEYAKKIQLDFFV
ncbi:helix-turn-helix domain-containing protein [Enterococcus sp. LJL98]